MTLPILLIAACMSVQAPADSIRYLALGDSYTIGESVNEQDRWPNLLAAAWREQGFTVAKPTIIATTGWRTDNLRNAMTIAKLQPVYNVVSLLIGVNNQYQGKSVSDYEKEFEALLFSAIELAGGRKENVFVVSIPDYGFTPFGKNRQEKISTEINTFNAINERITKATGVTYVQITDISREGLQQPELVAADGLHPSGKMYRLWVERILAAYTLKR